MAATIHGVRVYTQFASISGIKHDFENLFPGRPVDLDKLNQIRRQHKIFYDRQHAPETLVLFWSDVDRQTANSI